MTTIEKIASRFVFRGRPLTGAAPDRRAERRPGRDALWAELTVTESALKRLPDPERFDHYQRAVKRLLDEALDRCTVHRETYRSPLGRFQRMVYVTAVDRELARLREALVDQHPGTVILKGFDAIRGLLLDLFT